MIFHKYYFSYYHFHHEKELVRLKLLQQLVYKQILSHLIQQKQNLVAQMQKRKRNNSLYHHVEAHCPEDLSCRPCCPCVPKLQMQIKILKEKVMNLAKDNKQKEQLLLKLTKQLKKWQSKAEQFTKMDDFKDKIRKIIKKQLQQQNRLQIFILKQKYDSMKKDKQAFQLQNSNLQQQNLQLKQQFQKINRKLKQKDKMIEQIRQQKGNIQRMVDQYKNKMKDNIGQIEELERINKDKSMVIEKLLGIINQSDRYIAMEKDKSSTIQFQAEKIQQALKNKQQELLTLHKTSEQKIKSIQNLTVQKQTLKNQKSNLNKLVAELDSTIHSYSQLSSQLRQRLLISQDYAIMKQIQAKKMEIDLYDSLHQRIIPFAMKSY